MSLWIDVILPRHQSSTKHLQEVNQNRLMRDRNRTSAALKVVAAGIYGRCIKAANQAHFAPVL